MLFRSRFRGDSDRSSLQVGRGDQRVLERFLGPLHRDRRYVCFVAVAVCGTELATFADHEKQIKKIEDAEARRDKDERQWALVKQKVDSVSFPLQLLRVQYANQTKGKSYSDDEDRFLLCQVAKYGVGKEDTFEQIKRDIAEFPAFR